MGGHAVSWSAGTASAPTPVSTEGGQVFNQFIASQVWVIDHNFPRLPAVTVYDTEEREISGAVEATTPTRITITFSMPLSGTAVLI